MKDSVSGSQPAWRLASTISRAQRQVDEQQAVEFLLGQVGAARAEHELPAGQRDLQFGEGALALPSARDTGRPVPPPVRLSGSSRVVISRYSGSASGTPSRRYSMTRTTTPPARGVRCLGEGSRRLRYEPSGRRSWQGNIWLDAHPPEQVGARGPRRPPQLEADEGRGRPGTACRAAAAPAAAGPARPRWCHSGRSRRRRSHACRFPSGRAAELREGAGTARSWTAGRSAAPAPVRRAPVDGGAVQADQARPAIPGPREARLGQRPGDPLEQLLQRRDAEPDARLGDRRLARPAPCSRPSGAASAPPPAGSAEPRRRTPGRYSTSAIT